MKNENLDDQIISCIDSLKFRIKNYNQHPIKKKKEEGSFFDNSETMCSRLHHNNNLDHNLDHLNNVQTFHDIGLDFYKY